MAHPQIIPPPARPGAPDELETSVAGEEDPGASLDLVDEEPPLAPGSSEKPQPQPRGGGAA